MSSRALDAALSYLSYRPRSREEVRRKLSERGFTAAITDLALERLEELGLVNDADFIELYVRDRIGHRPMGVRRMASELCQKGIARELSTPAIERVLREEGVDEFALALRAAEKRREALEGRDSEDVRRQLFGHLVRRGFTPALARSILAQLIPRA